MVYDPFARPGKVYAPEALAVVVAVDVPVSAIVAPLPDVPTPPVIVQVCAVAVKLPAVAFAPLTVTAILAGLKIKPVRLGVMVYAPFARPENVYAPEALAVVVAIAVPVNAMVAPLPEVPTPPVMVQVCAVAVKLPAVTFAPLTVTVRLAGLNVKPLKLGVIVYDPFASPGKVYAPEALAVVVAVDVPDNAMVAPLPDVPTPPVIVQVCAVAVKLPAVAFAPLTVTARLAGLNV